MMAKEYEMAQTKSENGRVTKAERTFKTSIDIPEKNRQAVIALLNIQLANTFDLFSQTKQAHWNVKGPNFYQLHELYDELAESLLAHIDSIAERANALGGFVKGTARMAAGASELEDYAQDAVLDTANIEALAKVYAKAAESTRKAADEAEKQEDMVTNDLLIGVAHDLDKYLWFLEAHLQGR